MSRRFTVSALRSSRIMLISKYDPCIDWQAMEQKGIYFDEAAMPETPAAFDVPVVYDALLHSASVEVLEGESPIKFYVHSPTSREKITAYEMAGIELGTESGVSYVGTGGGASYSPGNGALIGMTSYLIRLAHLCIDRIVGADFPYGFELKFENSYGLKELRAQAIEILAPLDEYTGEPLVEALTPLFLEIGRACNGDEGEVGNSFSV